MTERKTSASWHTFIGLLMLMAGYAGTYAIAVRPAHFMGARFSADPVYFGAKPFDGSAFISDFFAPIHGLDRRVRPDVWGPRNRPGP